MNTVIITHFLILSRVLIRLYNDCSQSAHSRAFFAGLLREKVSLLMINVRIKTRALNVFKKGSDPEDEL